MTWTHVCIPLLLLMGRAASPQEEEKPSKSQVAEEAFKKIEKRIQEAKTLKIKFKSEITSPWVVQGTQCRSTNSGLFLAQKGNKASLSGLVVRFEGSVQNRLEYSLVSDGTRMEEWIRPGRARPNSATSENFDTVVRDLLVRISPSAIFESLGSGSAHAETAAKGFQAFDFRVLPDNGARKGLSYSLKGLGEQEARVTLWYDEESYRPISRTIEVMHSEGVVESTTRDTYEEFALNPDLPADTFKLPEK